jgi:putative tryptophan/tyrosine transport system substrate-binding protein
MFDKRRRDFITLLGGAAAAWPISARAQQPAMPVIGFIHPGSASAWPFRSAFRRGLQDAGYVEGQNVAVEYRWAEGHYDRLPALAADLVAKQVAVIVVGGGTAPIHAAKATTARIPIVFFTGTDPVADGLVENFARPSGNLTGAYVLNNVLVAKQLEIMHEAVPTATTIAVLDNPSGPSAGTRLRELNGAALALGLKLQILDAGTESEVAGAFASIVGQRAGGLVVGADPFLTGRRDQIAGLALRHAVPMIGSFREYAAAGGLMSYGPDFNDGYRLIASYAARILKGAHLVDLPVQQSTRVEFVVNLRTAKILGLSFPLPLIGRADEVIE